MYQRTRRRTLAAAAAMAALSLVAATPTTATYASGGDTEPVSAEEPTAVDQSAAPAQLLARTTFESDGNGTAPLILDSAATVDPEATTGHTAGEVAVLVIRQPGQLPSGDQGDSKGVIVVIDQDGDVTTSALQSIDDVEEHELPAGEYEVHVAAQGATSLSLAFTGAPDGQATIAPTTDNGATIAAANDVASGAGQTSIGTVHSAGRDAQLASAGLLVGIIKTNFDAHASTRFGGCLYDGHPTGPAPYLPGCLDPAGIGSPTPSVGVTAVLPETGSLRVTLTTELEGGPYGWGAWLTSASVGNVLEHHIVTLPYGVG